MIDARTISDTIGLFPPSGSENLSHLTFAEAEYAGKKPQNPTGRKVSRTYGSTQSMGETRVQIGQEVIEKQSGPEAISSVGHSVHSCNAVATQFE